MIYKNALYLDIKIRYFTKLVGDFLFFIFLLREYSLAYKSPSINFLRNFIYLLILLSMKYILYIKYNKMFYLNNYNFYQIYNIELFYWKYKSLSNYKKGSYINMEQKVLLISKISRTREKGRIKRYKAIVLVGEKSGWFGIGCKKSYYLQEAISSARLHAFKNIYHISLFYSNLLKHAIYLNKKSKKLYLFPAPYRLKPSANYFIRILFDFIGINNIASKIMGVHNIYNLLSLIVKI